MPSGRSTCLSTAGVEAKRRFLEIADQELRDRPLYQLKAVLTRYFMRKRPKKGPGLFLLIPFPRRAAVLVLRPLDGRTKLGGRLSG